MKTKPPESSTLPFSASNEEKPKFEKMVLTYPDPFSPSRAEFSTTDPQGINSVSRHFFYNSQISETLSMALNWAVELGLPKIDYKFGLGFAFITKETFRYIAGFAHRICPGLVEGSPDWLAVQCYLRWVVACHSITEPTTLSNEDEKQLLLMPEQSAFRQREMTAIAISQSMFFLGAAVRELELNVLNRTDALRGKKTVRSSKSGGEARREAIKGRTEEILVKMAELIDQGQTTSRAATLAFKGGFGTSHSGNVKLWSRHKE